MKNAGIEYKYLNTEELAENTTYKSLFNEWNMDRFSIVVMDGKYWYVESRGLTARTCNILHREMKRLYPELVHYMEV